MSSSSRSRAVAPVIGGGSVIPKELLLDGSRITVHRESLLGEGGFAKVYRATVRLRGRSSSNGSGEERTVAFKRLNDGVKSVVGAEMLAAELKVLSQWTDSVVGRKPAVANATACSRDLSSKAAQAVRRTPTDAADAVAPWTLRLLWTLWTHRRRPCLLEERRESREKHENLYKS